MGVVALLAGLPLGVAQAISVVGSGTGPIPDNNPAGLTVSFQVAGLSSPVSSVELALDITHAYIGDLRAELRSPDGLARLVVFSRVGLRTGSTFGAPANLAGVYRFSDTAPGDLRAVAAPLGTAAVVPPGRYRTSTGGTAGTLRGGCSTWLKGAFGGLSPAQANGTWTLNIADFVGGDTGTLNAAVLSVRGSQDDLFAEDFDPPVPGSCQLARMDYTASGRTSYVVMRNTGGGPNGEITWFVRSNDGTGTGTLEQFVHGRATDFLTDGDFDGDGIADAVAWRPGVVGQFLVRRSSRPLDAVLVIPWGQNGDDPNQIGDFDGDRIDDATVYRPGAQPGDASRTLVRLSGGGPDRNFITGQRGQFASIGADYTGNGRADIAVQSDAGGGQALFTVFSGDSGAVVTSFLFGTPSDFIVLGNHTGSPRADTTVIRTVGGQRQWTTRNGETGVVQPEVLLGNAPGDVPLNGDYDGDGLDDYGFWRPSTTPGLSRFFIRRSSAPASPLEVPLGQQGDVPLANSRVK